MSPDSAAAKKEADIEDLFTDDDYLVLYNAALQDALKPSDLTGSDRIVRRVARARGSDFDHNKPARYLLHNRDALVPKFSADSLDRFEHLISEINATLS